MAKFVRHIPCELCGSRDARALHADGSSWCWSCKKYLHGDGKSMNNVPVSGEAESAADEVVRVDLEDLGIAPIPARGLTQESCEMFNYRGGMATFVYKTHTAPPEPCQVAVYQRPDGKTASKVRTADKRFTVVGNGRKLGFYGQWLWRSEGKMLVITEGEIDALSVSQVMAHKWPVVSVPTGSAGAARVVQQELEWLEGFERVVFLFDMDKPGQDAVQECAALLTPGKAFVASIPMKDANEMLVAGRGSEVVRAIWDAKEWRPDGVTVGSDLTFEEIFSEPVLGYSTPYPELDAKTRGVRKRELTLLCASTGVGKSTLSRELGYHMRMHHGLKVANIYLEERQSKTAQGYIAIHMGVPLGRLRAEHKAMDQAALRKAYQETIASSDMFFHNHFGSLDGKKLLKRIKYFAKGVDADFIILDHISIAISGLESSKEGERKDIDKLMTALRSLIEETGVGIIAVAHLKRAEGKSFSRGAEVDLSDLRGSATLEQIPDTIIAMERNQQGEEDQHISRLRVLKNREFGTTGVAGSVVYDVSTGRLMPDYPTAF